MKHRWFLAAVAVAAVVAIAGCETTPVQQGALIGGALGAGGGAIIGNQIHGQGGTGALIGAGAGALTGALVGDQVRKNRERQNTTYVAPPPPPPPAPAPPPPPPVQRGHYETRVVTSATGETYEERVWVPDR